MFALGQQCAGGETRPLQGWGGSHPAGLLQKWGGPIYGSSGDEGVFNGPALGRLSLGELVGFLLSSVTLRIQVLRKDIFVTEDTVLLSRKRNVKPVMVLKGELERNKRIYG